MSELGFVMLCHTALHRAAEVARHLATRDCPVVIHVDARVKRSRYEAFCRTLEDLDQVRFIRRQRCEWGTWSLVRASQAAAELLLAACPAVRHVYLVSESCLPIRPVEELRAYLAERPTTDFIESVAVEDADWAVGGLNDERFRLWFPFSWKRHRLLFDRFVDLQRRVGVRRKLPEGLAAHLGSQWWCLTRETLTAILQDPRRRALERYFRLVWIPDEAYYQTLARKYGHVIESRPLTLSKFDFQGRPHVLYDDHLHLLRRSECFFARKIWPGANRLYDSFLTDEVANSRMEDPAPDSIDRIFATARDRRTRGRPGLYMHSRFPRPARENGKTAAPYAVLCGFDDLFEDFEPWLAARLGAPVHGHLFDPEGARFSDAAPVHAGCLSSSAALRDYAPERFLTSLIWNTRDAQQVFMFGPRDSQRIGAFMAGDPNAKISVITGAWALGLYRSNRDVADIRRDAAQMQRREADFVDALRHATSGADARIWTLAEFLEEPMENLQRVLNGMAGSNPQHGDDAPRMVDLSGLAGFVQSLRNQGMSLITVGDFPQDGLARRRPVDGNRPCVVT